MLVAVASFALAASLLIVAPGPDSLLVIRNTVAHGRRGGLITAAGTVTGLSLWAVAAVFGLAGVLRASTLAYNVLCVAGAAYLIWLGVASLRSGPTTPTELPKAAPSPKRRWAMYAAGLVSNVVNPKIGVFFVALLPGFVPADVHFGPAAALFGALFVVETGLWLVLLTSLVQRGADWLSRPRVGQWVQRITGFVLAGFGVKLATETR